jgi:hypothetical protein
LKILLIVLLVACLVGVAVIAAAQFNFDPLPRDAIADRILVEKSARRLTLFQKGRALKIYSVALGRAPEGAKEYEGDQRTPEGIYSIDFHKPDSDYHLAAARFVSRAARHRPGGRRGIVGRERHYDSWIA